MSIPRQWWEVNGFLVRERVGKTVRENIKERGGFDTVARSVVGLRHYFDRSTV